MDLNLDTLKREVAEYLDASGFAVFHGHPGGMDSTACMFWDTEHFPDFQAFLEVARQSGAKLIVFGTHEFSSEDIEELMAQLEACEMPREERRELESRIREMRIFEGVTCSLELAFDYHSRLYVFEVRPDWYEEFMTFEDEIAAHLTADKEIDDDDSLGGYYSKN